VRTNIDIDDRLIADVMKASGAKTKKEAVDSALRHYLQILGQRRILDYKRKLKWEGDLEAMRRDRRRC
jgi:Arc/MetJ family transcription regulator